MLEYRLAECDENLAGTVLSAAERAHFTAMRKTVYLALHPETAQHVAGAHAVNAAKGNATAKLAAAEDRAKSTVSSFVDDTARKTGVDVRTVHQRRGRGAA
jgi:ParB family transcriptional regulator, chromosome partitioning protein